MHELALFAGAGGGILGGHLLGWTTIAAVEINPYCREVLLCRQLDGCLPRFPVWDDVCTFDGKPWRGIVDVISGGFPCQDISSAGKGAGITGARSGLWKEFARIIREVGPRFVLVENSPMLTARGFGVVLGDLAAMGFDAEWGVLGAVDAGAPHRRDRIWIVAHDENEHGKRYSSIIRGEVQTGVGDDSQTNDSDSHENGEYAVPVNAEVAGASESVGHTSSGAAHPRSGVYQGSYAGAGRNLWWEVEPDVGRVADGVAHRVDRLAAIGNGQVPAVVQLAWDTLKDA